jgi:hypothetical protein
MVLYRHCILSFFCLVPDADCYSRTHLGSLASSWSRIFVIRAATRYPFSILCIISLLDFLLWCTIMLIQQNIGPHIDALLHWGESNKIRTKMRHTEWVILNERQNKVMSASTRMQKHTWLILLESSSSNPTISLSNYVWRHEQENWYFTPTSRMNRNHENVVPAANARQQTMSSYSPWEPRRLCQQKDL